MRALLVSTMRNEAPFVLEWVAHHLGAGFTDLLVYSNDCADGTDALLGALADAGVLTHVAHRPDPGKSVQWQALQAAWKHPLRRQADWVLVSDADEFLNVHAGDRSLAALIAALPRGTDAVALPWRFFGHNDVADFIDAPVTAQFTRAIPGDCTYPVQATFFKTLFRTDGPFNQLGVHRPKQKKTGKARLPRFADGSGETLPESFAAAADRLALYGTGVGRSLAEINHYAVRSAASFLVKRDRGLPNRASKPVDLDYWVTRCFNTEETLEIAAMAPATAAQLDRLRAIPGVPELHDAGVDWHIKRFNDLLRDPDMQRLYARVLTAGSSAVLSKSLQRRLVSDFATANAG